MYKWCTENLYHGGHYEPQWYWDKDYFVFTCEQEYIWFKLRWG